MYAPGHQDSTVAALRIPGSYGGGHKSSLDRHRTASVRLSCISEHQKENTPTSEDDGFSSPAPAAGIKTPLLEPVRWPHSHRRGKGMSCSSGDGSTISPFLLDFEPVEEAWRQGTHHNFVLPSWRRATSAELMEQIEQQPEAPDVHPSGPTLLLEVPGPQGQMAQWTEAQPTQVCVRGRRGALLTTGFDGPRSSTSGTSPFHSPPDARSPPLGSLSLSNCLSCEPRERKPATQGSIDWEKSWPKRKPRRQHDVSESSDLDSSVHSRPANSSHTNKTNDKNDTALLEGEEQEGQSRPRNIQDCTFKSCPEFYQRSPSAAVPSTSRYIPGQGFGLEPPNLSRLDTTRHFIPERVSRRFRSLRERLRRGRSSSMYSIRPEFPPPPDGRERRYRSRNSNDIWPSSGEESPIFNTPVSNISPVQPAGHHGDLLAATGLAIATAELDRLTGSPGNTPKTHAATSLDLARASAASSMESAGEAVTTNPELGRISGSNDSPRSESGSSAADMATSSSSLFPPGGLGSPMSRSPKRLGRQSRRQHSRLSEVTTPEEIGSPARLCDSSAISSQDLSPDFGAERDESLVPRPLSIGRPSSANDKPGGEANGNYTQLSPTLKYPSETTIRPGIILTQRTPSRGQTPEPTCDHAYTFDEGDPRQSSLDQIPSTERPSIKATKSEPSHTRSVQILLERMDIIAQESALFAGMMQRLNPAENEIAAERSGSNSCHPDTLSEDQGETGDSEPFCPPVGLYSKQSKHDS
ncbi:hypothetical protein F5B17DRAFT_316589 [Nemania serpens]|nr:hypothetical protein F5B17DRAFT_316589 [Nemania serpens]